MRQERYPEDLGRLRDAIRDELAVQHGIEGREVDGKWLDVLADMISSRIDYGFDIRWAPKWVAPGSAHQWEEDGEHFAECLRCRIVTVHESAAGATQWYTAHLSDESHAG